MEIGIAIGIGIGTMIIEPVIINCIYLSNIDLFNDIIITKKNSEKLKKYYTNKKFKKEEIKVK